ncbi:aminoacyl-tRNA hydrolase [[Limnothrix rosea] IAM M-220]|uniref:aminoacyl-tRNA hydrolase n=1 Tax=[Limnothrix rosea] IAM M-220 TaxID=454133 RepID=UPI00095CF68C|nr:aminoacyl-tRNA hydrolase [[Limnothrix rosea] IAM M-220]OKH15081.1 aminoacyl-tRNA hydrolase [[Limnothrix rosea] IAM M-220]
MGQTTSLVIPQLIVGLGNPEPKYDRTRHNIGFEFVDRLASDWGVSLQENKKFHGFWAEARHDGKKLGLLKPTTYMNRSGQSLRAVVDWYKIPPESVLVVYDDMDLPLGRLRLRLTGSAGGHNGIKSIISHLGTKDFPRLRIGIGKARFQGDRQTISHVLGKFSPDEQPILKKVLTLSEDALSMSLKEGVEKAMSLYNGRSVEQ